jgi:hypothetical protein
MLVGGIGAGLALNHNSPDCHLPNSWVMGVTHHASLRRFLYFPDLSYSNSLTFIFYMTQSGTHISTINWVCFKSQLKLGTEDLPVILATWEEEIRKIVVQSQLGQIVLKTHLQNNQSKVHWLKW